MTELPGTDETLVAAPGSFDDPEAYIARDRRVALAAGVELPDRVFGAALFADISGFTPLTEALAAELGPERGAEELTANLNRIFHAIIAELDRFGGDVIYFSGDAITCWLDGDEGIRALTAAFGMQAAMARVGEVVTPGGTRVRLAMKVAVAVGPARRFVVGDPEIQLIEVLAGRLVDDLAAAESVAEQGEIVLDESAFDALGERVDLAEVRVDEDSGRRVGLVAGLLEPAAEAPGEDTKSPLPEELVRQWVLPAVYERLRTGRGEFLAELRPAIPFFVRFTGIEYDKDDAAAEKLDDFVRRAQRVLTAYGGNLLQLTLGDKGAYLYAVFGSPHAHEDDAARACAAALDLLELERETAARELQVGITQGRLRSGTYGHDRRRTFVCLGDAVNLAARLMSKAEPGEVYVEGAIERSAGDAFTWRSLPPMTIKGKADVVTVFALTGASERRGQRQIRYDLPIVGRRKELDALDDALARSLDGAGNVVGISAEAGVGKSRLLAEFVRGVRSQGVLAVYGECQSFGSATSYLVWREIWRRLLRVDDELAEPEQLRALEAELERIDPALVPRLPLLGTVLNLQIPDNALTGPLDAELRKTSLETLLADCMRAHADEEPLVLVLEDCHWIDPLSRDLLEVVARAAESLPVLVVLAYRPAAEPGGGLGLRTTGRFAELTLGELEPAEAELLIRSKVEQLAGEGTEAPAALVELVTARSQGNPFYLEELLNYIRGQSVELDNEAALAKLRLPESLHSLVLSRVDTLSEAPRRTLKVASVVGRAFRAPALPKIYPELGGLDDVRKHLGALRSLDLVTLDREADESYVFKHVVTQEVAYESTPYALRADLHERVGCYIEASEPDAVDRSLDLLAHHYWLSGNDPKKREYLVRAGEAAKAQYANAAAIDYFERIAPLLESDERWRVIRSLGEVREVAGDWAGAETSYREAATLADSLGDGLAGAWTETSLADLFLKRGDYDRASTALDTARERFERLGDRAGLGRVLHLAGTFAAKQGDLDAAREAMEASLEIRREMDDKPAMGALLSNLAIVAEYQGDLEEARALHEQGLEVRVAAADLAGVAVSQMNLGVILFQLGRLDEGRAFQEQSLELRREMGDPWMIALGEHNLGILTRSQGDYETTKRLFAGALRVQRDQGDKWSLAFMLDDVAVLAALVGRPALAIRLAGAGAALREETGTTRGAVDQEDLDRALAPAREALGADAEREWEAGCALGLVDAIRQALELCDDEASDPKV